MPANIESLCSGLQSTRIRDRNDSLNSLEDVVSSLAQSAYSAKQVSLVISSTFSLIAKEKVLCLKSANNSAIESRIVRASSCIKHLIERSIKGTASYKLRYKHFQTVLNEIKETLLVESTYTIFWPCAFELTQIVNMITQLEFVKEHLDLHEWHGIFRFLVRTIEFALDEVQNYDENLMLELFICVSNLIQADKSSSVSYLQLIAKTETSTSGAYFQLLPLLTKSVKRMKKEGAMTVVLFKIINKLIIILSTEDFYFVHKMVLLGITLLVSFNNTKLSTIQYQMVIFLNLDGVHDYLINSSLPTMKTVDQRVDECDEMDISIRSNESQDRNIPLDFAEDFEDQIVMDDKVLHYNIGVIIQSSINILGQPGLQISGNDIGITHVQNTSTWFRLSSIYLTNDSEENELPWLLNLGVARLIASYYRLKRSLNSWSSSQSASKSRTPEPMRNTKRQKLDLISQIIHSSNSVLEFICSLLETRPDVELQRICLQLMVFHLQQQRKETVIGENSKANAQIPSSSSNNSEEPNTTTISDVDVTILNSAFACDPSPHTYTKNTLIRIVLNSFDQAGRSNLNFWVLMACKSIVESTAPTVGDHLSNKFYLQLFKLTLPLVNSPTSKFISNLSSNLIHVLYEETQGDVHKLIDSTIIIQLDKLFELSEVNGPSHITYNSFLFWFSIHNLIQKTGLHKKINTQVRVQEWALANWEQLMDKTSTNIGDVSKFLLWLCGVDIVHRYSDNAENSNRYQGPLNEIFLNMVHFSKLQRFIVDKTVQDPHISYETFIDVGGLGYSAGGKTNEILARIGKEVDRCLATSPVDQETLLNRLLLVSNVLVAIKNISAFDEWKSSLDGKSSHIVDHFSNTNLEKRMILHSLKELNSTSPSLLLKLYELLKEKDASLLINSVSIKSLIDNVHHMHSSSPNVIRLSQDAFDTEFASTKHIQNTLKDIPNFNYIISGYLKNGYEDLVDFLIGLGESKICEYDFLFLNLLNFLDSLDAKDAMYTTLHLLKRFRKKQTIWITIPTPLIRRLLRIIGEGPLAIHELERNEITIIVISQLLLQLLPVIQSERDKDLNKDWSDFSNWLLKCGEKKLIQSERSMIEFTKFLIFAIPLGEEYVTSFLNNFIYSSNNVKIHVVNALVNSVFNPESSGCSIQKQIELYRRLFLQFKNPQQSIEMSATFCLFYSSLAKFNGSILASTVFNLIEYARFSFILPYIKTSIDNSICSHFTSTGIFTSRELFKLLRVDLFRFWFSYNKGIDDFPYELFGYSSLIYLVEMNYRELVSISLSLKGSSSNSGGYDMLNHISKVRNSDNQSIVIDSFPTIVALAYTESGVKNEIHGILKSLLGKAYSEQFKLRLPIIVFEIIKLLDVSDEKRLISGDFSSSIIDNKFSEIFQPNYVCIPTRTGTELLSSLIGKYSKSLEEFWEDSRVQFFLIRRISFYLTKSRTVQERVSTIRKIKFILIQGHKRRNQICESQLTYLLYETLCPFLNDRYIAGDCLDILSSCKFEKVEIAIVVKTLRELSAGSGNHLGKRDKLLRTLEDHNKRIGHCNSSVHLILNSVIRKLSSTSSMEFEDSISIQSIESLLSSTSDFEMCKVNGTCEDIMHLLSLVFPPFSGEIVSVNDDVFSHLLEIPAPTIQLLKDTPFMEWCGMYLGESYLRFGYMPSKKEPQVSKENSVMVTKSLNDLLSRALNLLGTKDNSVNASIESILGVLIWKFESNRAEVIKFLDFTSYYQRYRSYIIPIDFHSCVHLHSNENQEDMVIPIVTLKEVIVSMSKENIGQLSFQDWSTRFFLALTSEIARFTSIAPLFSTLVLKEPSFANTALPGLLCVYIALNENDNSRATVCTILKLFTCLNFDCLDENYSDLFLKIVLAIRTASKFKMAQFQHLYADLDFLRLFKVAASVKPMHATSLMILEDAISIGSSCSTDLLNSQTKLLQYVYENIDDDDLIFGLPIEPSLDYAMNILNKGDSYYDQLKFNSGLFDADITMSSKPGTRKDSNVIHAMMENGLLGLSSMLTDNEGSHDSTYEWAWKLNSWELPIPSQVHTENSSLYKTLKQIHDYPDAAFATCQSSLLEVLQSKEMFINKRSWVKSIASIHSLAEVVRERSGHFSVRTSWFEEVGDFEAVENILLSRRALYQILGSFSVTEDKQTQWMSAMSELVRYNNISRLSDRFLQKSLNSTMLLKTIAETKFYDSADYVQDKAKYLSQFQSACTLWSQGETTTPVAILKELHNKQTIRYEIETSSSETWPEELNVSPSIIDAYLVKWMSESRQESPSTIMSQYVIPTYEVLQNHPDVQDAKIYQIFAQFCEKQLRSRSLQDKLVKTKSSIKNRKQEIDELKAHYNKKVVNPKERESIQRYYSKLKSQYNLEIQELAILEANKNELSDKAVEFYLKSTMGKISKGGDEDIGFDETVDKFFALWLEYSNKEELNQKLRKDLVSLPTHKLVNWCPQLMSRLSTDQSEFQKSLQILILQLCKEHPFHSIYNLISLTRHESSTKLNPTSTYAAQEIFQKLKKAYVNNKVLLDIEKFCDESIKLAEVKAASKGRSFQLDKVRVAGISELDMEWWLNELPSIPPPTMELKIDLTLSYRSFPTMKSVEPKIEIATSGLSLPKIAKFHLSDGSTHKMLLKHGADDLRQDSIMEQVFEKVNQMFWKDKNTRKRQLRVRTYKAVPLGPQNGIIEFVPNSMALIDVIRPYHQIRDKLKVETAREKMKKCQAESKGHRLSVYEDITVDKIQPVLKYFFLDTFKTPEEWFQSRIVYTHGIAATSIVGYMLGLGDRHCNNILLDKETGEPIHIDLGVAFDQGKRLPIPETVPFRLTRDIVDGFGITGVEGVFKKSCEHSFRVLRENKDHVVAILDVLRWDPLYSWSLSPLRKNKLQDGDSTIALPAAATVVAPVQPHEDGSEAGRAINKVADKLVGGGLSVEATVRELIQEATSKENLALIYCGWCPFF